MSTRLIKAIILLSAAAAAASAQTCSGTGCLEISQIYGGGGNSGAILTNDYIEIFNRGSAPVPLDGLSVQYASATGTSWQFTLLTGNLGTGQFYLIRESAGTGGTTPLPTPDASGNIAMSATAGKVALVNSTVALGAVACPTADPVLDIVGYGTTSCTPSAPVLTNTTADLRNDLCAAGPLPSSAFTAGTPNPRNTATAPAPCGVPTLSISPSTLPTGMVGVPYSLTFTTSGGNGSYSYTSAGTLPPGLTLSPSGVLSGTPTTATGSPFSFTVTVTDGTLMATQSYSLAITPEGGSTCMVTKTIPQIQGSGLTSPVVATTVTTSGIVTALRTNGFFVQAPAPGDSDPATSDGIFVFTSSTPPSSASIGSSVCVTATVQEFQPDAGYSTITELITPVVSQLAAGGPLPAPVVLTSADFDPNGGIYQREKYEGMRVAVNALAIVAPTQGNVSEANATATSNGIFFGVIPGTPRPFREPGVDVNDTLPPGSPPTIPRWDSNPEILRVNTALLVGSTPVNVTTGATVSNLVGVVDYKFGQYTLLTDPAPVPPISATGNITYTALPAALANDLTLGSFNIQRFFDTTNDPNTQDVVLTPAAFANRLTKLSLAVRTVLLNPDVLALEEVENLTTAQAIAAQIDADAMAAGQPTPGYTAYVVPGNDIGGINNGFLIKTSKVTVADVTQYGKDATYTDPTTGMQAILNDRPPLVLHGTAQAPGSNQVFAFTVIANHLRSLIDVNDNTPSGMSTNGARVRAKREAAAEYLANLVQSFQVKGEKVFTVGDLNAYQVNDGYVDVVGVIRGNPAPPSEDVVPAVSGLVSPILTDGVDLIVASQRYSDTFDGTAQVLDHVLFTSNVSTAVRQVAYGRLNPDFPEVYRNDITRPERVSDHDPVIAYVTLPASVLPVDVTAQTNVRNSTLSYDRPTQTYSGTLTVVNTTRQPIAGPIQVLFTDLLPAGATLVNASGTSGGSPYLTVSSTGLAARASVTVNIQFKYAGIARITYTPLVYSGIF